MWHFQDASQNGAQEGAYKEVIPPEMLSYPWEAGNQSTQVEFRLSDVDGGTQVDLSHGGWAPGQESEEVRQMHARVWSGYMNNLKLYFEVIAYEPNRMVKATSTAGSFPITFTRIVEPDGAGTKVSAIIEGDASGFFKLAEPLLKRMVQKSVDGDYRNLKRILEKTPGPKRSIL
jgi:hypothetical protein